MTDYNEMFKVGLDLDWCAHKKELWKILNDHINNFYSNPTFTPSVSKEEVIEFVDSYFKAPNFAYAYYEPIEGDPLFLIAKSKDAKDYIHKEFDLQDIFESFLSSLGLIFCTLKGHLQYFNFHRVDEDLSFREISAPDLTVKVLATAQTCCERMIFENIVSHLYAKELKKETEEGQEKFSAVLEGEIKIFTEMEPCIRCYGLMRFIQDKNEKLDIKVRYNEWAPKEIQGYADFKSLANIVRAFPSKAFHTNKEDEDDFNEDVINDVIKENRENGVSLGEAFVRVAKNMSINNARKKCDYKSP